ncbi:MAG: SAM-dependent methyltransferase [Bdellovibrio sp.]
MKRITVVGRGMDPAKHLTLDAIRALRQADVVIGIEPEIEAWATLKQDFGVPDIQDVGYLYKNGAKDEDNYANFIKHILSVSETYQNTVLVVAGHPRLGVTFAQMLSQEKNLDCEIRFIEGLSSFDVMLNDLAMDPLERGTAIWDVNRALLFEYKMEPSTNYFLYHVCSVGNSSTNFQDASEGNQLVALQNYLLKFYSPEKSIYLCKASNGEKHSAEYTAVLIKDLVQNGSLIDFGTTLLVPAENPTHINREFLNTLRGAV